ncbi:zinc-binding protein A33-like [Centropristis striata]|uniref:zinc-binding protein A33-like n=1 Tax=Centropristis striata TaxID=184440 RepID=UPI0027DFB29C|nr:zinc-binding protein A33-like [Centropristis striata]
MYYFTDEEEVSLEMASAPSKDLSCPVCCDIFKDPVLLPCGHSFCSTCVQTWWATKRRRECPVCKAVCFPKKPPPNRALKSLCEAYTLEMDSGVFCRSHGERLKLYCQDHQTPICVVCRDSRDHTGHTFIPVDEAAEFHRNAIRQNSEPLREKVKLFNEMRANWEKTDVEIEKQAQETEKKIREDFKVLQEFLQTEEKSWIAALEEEERIKRKTIKDKLSMLTYLESTMNTIEAGLRQDDTTFMLKVSDLARASQRPLPRDPVLETGARIEVSKYLSNLKFRVWSRMKSKVSYTPVTLNPNTSHSELHLSEDLTSVKFGPDQSLAPIPERMMQHRSVLSYQSFTSGQHWWDVEVGDNPIWALGVMAVDAQKIGDLVSGLWLVRFCNSKFTAYSPSCPGSVLPRKERLQRVRLHLDWDRGKLSFFDADTRTVVHTFTHRFTSMLFPYINTWSDIPLKILPSDLTVMTKSKQYGVVQL